MASNSNLSEDTDREIASDSSKSEDTDKQMVSDCALFKDVDKDFLTCSICRDIFKHPKQLKCMHSFCQDCLENLVKKGTRRKVRCPLCCEEVELDVDKVSKMKDNVFLSNLCELFVVTHLNTLDVVCSFCSKVLDKDDASHCLDCSDNLCSKCAKVHTLTRLTRNHKVVLISEIETKMLVNKAREEEEEEENIKIPCQKHLNNYLEYFCQTCQVPVCLGCTVVDHASQKGHQLLNLDYGLTKQKFKEQITKQVKKLEEVIPSFKKNIDIANEAEKKLVESLEKTKNDIRETAKILIKEIETSTNSLIEKVDARAEAIQKIIEHHREAAEVKLESSNGINKFARNLCKHGKNAEIMSSATDLERRMKELQEDMKDIEETGELRFIDQKEFKLGIVEECRIIEREDNVLKAFAEKEIGAGQHVKRGPHWPSGYDGYDNHGQQTNNSVQSVQRNGSNVQVKVRSYNRSIFSCTMNPTEYWLQPSNPIGNYMSRLQCYAENIMQVGDEVKRGLHWPNGWRTQDNDGQKTGKITEINIDAKGNTTAVVEFAQQRMKLSSVRWVPGSIIFCPLSHSHS